MLVAYIDSEDPDLSSWVRYVNHESEARVGCNLRSRVDGRRRLVWFEASRDIAPGEELAYDYGAAYWAPRGGLLSVRLRNAFAVKNKAK